MAKMYDTLLSRNQKMNLRQKHRKQAGKDSQMWKDKKKRGERGTRVKREERACKKGSKH